jgi:hypothetical protein
MSLAAFTIVGALIAVATHHLGLTCPLYVLVCQSSR